MVYRYEAIAYTFVSGNFDITRHPKLSVNLSLKARQNLSKVDQNDNVSNTSGDRDDNSHQDNNVGDTTGAIRFPPRDERHFSRRRYRITLSKRVREFES